MTFDRFKSFALSSGGIDTDGFYGFQCMDLYNFYCKEVLEIKGNTGADRAKNILLNKNVMKNVERINNYLEFVPKKGDIAVFTGGEYGHVAICTGKGDTNYFETIDQNWKPQKITIEKHNYLYMYPIVFLRPKNQTNIKIENSYLVKITADVLNVREKPNIFSRRKTYNELTKNAREQVLKNCGYRPNGLCKGVLCSVLETKNDWGRIPSGWINLKYTKRVIK